MNFLAIDGEAFEGKYSLIQTSTGEEIFDGNGLTTDHCLSWFMHLIGQNKHQIKGTIFVGFAFKYDVENIVKDLPGDLKDKLFDAEKIIYQGYEIQYFPKKIFRVSLIDSHKSFVVYDVFSFFNTSFINTIINILREQPEQEIIEGKSERGGFTLDMLEKVKFYNKSECKYLVRIMNKVNEWLQSLDIELNHWHGPSAIANRMLQKWAVHEEFYRNHHDLNTPRELLKAWQCAYFGGRIEAFQLGHFKNVFQYDINSAYPAAMLFLPFLTRNGWQFQGKFDPNLNFSVWNVTWKLNNKQIVGPLPFREKDGSIKFPSAGRGWYWQPEIEALIKLYPGQYKINYGWAHFVARHPLSEKIQEVYKKRKELKAQGNPSEYILKIFLNSIYGKFAQRVGRPRFNCPAWAGFITSQTRARILWATQDYQKNIIAFSTDGILLNKEIPVMEYNANTELGGWSAENFDECNMLMSGFYNLIKDKKEKVRSRGHVKVNFDQALKELNEKGVCEITNTCFIGWKYYQKQKDAMAGNYLKFIQMTKEVNPENLTKRTYDLKAIKNWKKDHCGSKLIKGSVNNESAPSQIIDYDMDDLMIGDEY